MCPPTRRKVPLYPQPVLLTILEVSLLSSGASGVCQALERACDLSAVRASLIRGLQHLTEVGVLEGGMCVLSTCVKPANSASLE